MKLSETDVVWFPPNEKPPPNTPRVRLECSQSNWQRTYKDRWMPAGNAFDFHSVKPRDEHEASVLRLLSIFILFNTLVVRERIAPAEVHEAFLGIEEYRAHISPDAPGASP